MTVRQEVCAGFGVALLTVVGVSVLGILAAPLTAGRATANESRRADELVLAEAA